MPTQSDSDRQFETEVFPAELEEVRRRREAAGLPVDGLTGAPSPARGLIGLALSGGGIRTATFALGVVQTLSRRGLLSRVDYLSTVSGGGFTGGAVSSLLNDPKASADGENFPLADQPGVGDTVATRHLRNSQHYIAPGGLLDYIRMPALIIRGILVNFLMTVPYMLLVTIATDLAYIALGGPRRFFTWIPITATVLFLVTAATFPIVWRLFGSRFTWTGRSRYDDALGLLFLGALVSLAMIPLFALTDRAAWLMATDLPILMDRLPGRALRWTVAIGAALSLVTILVRVMPALATVRRMVGYAAVAVIGPVVMLGVYLIGCVYLIDPPGTNGFAALSLSRPATPEEIARLDGGVLPETLVGQVLMLETGTITLSTDNSVWTYDRGNHWAILSPDADGPVAVVSNFPVLRVWQTRDSHWLHTDDWRFIWFVLAWLSINAIFGNVNASSIHGFYRDRISRAYLIRRPADPASDVMTPTDTQTQSTLAGPGTQAPYHLLNVSLNLNGTTDVNVRGRNCDFFFFGKRYSGGRRTGYVDTAALERVHPHMNLGTAIAISGAAAAPNAGVATQSQLTFVMTMLDIRLGYWCPNPAFVRDASWFRRLALRLGTGPKYLVREALGQVSSAGPFVNLSDGGHIENLAIMQLLRRKCRLIIASDGEQDGNLRFDGLLRLILYARIDLGIEIEIDLSEIRRNDTGLSTRHHALGTIDYGNGETGYLLYLKSSITGDEGEVMRDYHLAHPDFPHESTANQFFNERQWEMYRSLGAHVADGALDGSDHRLDPVVAYLSGRSVSA